MAWPTDDLDTNNFNEGTDNPSLARLMLERVILRVKSMIASRGAVNGVCDLDGESKVPIARIPIGTGGEGVSAGNHNHDSAYLSSSSIDDAVQAHSDHLDTIADVGIGGDANQIVQLDSNGKIPVSSQTQIQLAPDTVGSMIVASYANNTSTARSAGFQVAGSSLYVSLNPNVGSGAYPWDGTGVVGLGANLRSANVTGTWEAAQEFRNGLATTWYYGSLIWVKVAL